MNIKSFEYPQGAALSPNPAPNRMRFMRHLLCCSLAVLGGTVFAVEQPDRVRDMDARWQQLQDSFVRDAGPVKKKGKKAGKSDSGE